MKVKDKLRSNILFTQVCEGLAFLHDSVKMIHRNISLGTVILNESGAWKIFGFDFCLANVAPVGQSPAWNFPVADQMLPASEFGQPGNNFSGRLISLNQRSTLVCRI